MERFLKSVLGKCFLYTLLCVFVFAFTVSVYWVSAEITGIHIINYYGIFIGAIFNIGVDILFIYVLNWNINNWQQKYDHMSIVNKNM